MGNDILELSSMDLSEYISIYDCSVSSLSKSFLLFFSQFQDEGIILTISDRYMTLSRNLKDRISKIYQYSSILYLTDAMSQYYVDETYLSKKNVAKTFNVVGKDLKSLVPKNSLSKDQSMRILVKREEIEIIFYDRELTGRIKSSLKELDTDSSNFLLLLIHGLNSRGRSTAINLDYISDLTKVDNYCRIMMNKINGMIKLEKENILFGFGETSLAQDTEINWDSVIDIKPPISYFFHYNNLIGNKIISLKIVDGGLILSSRFGADIFAVYIPSIKEEEDDEDS